MTVLYSTQATAIGGRSGWVASVDGALKVKLAKPRSLGGAGGAGSSPEHLFAAAYAASFLDALRQAAAQTGAEMAEDANVTVTVGVGPPDGEEAPKQGWALDVALALDLPDFDRETAQALARRAHALCPYSRALRERLEPRISIT
jgi:Ohr subfamily peroxiredoxin